MITELNDNLKMQEALDTINERIRIGNYDAIIVGAGITGATIAEQLGKRGDDVLVIDKRSHIAGNCYTTPMYGIDYHKYGAHIFRTSNEFIWNYVNSFHKFNSFNHKVVVNYNNLLYSFPINLLTMNQVYGINVSTPDQAETKLATFKNTYPNPQNLKEQCINMIGPDLFEIFIRGYTEKQWGKTCEELPADIIKRIPVRSNANDSYFGDDKKYQGIPDIGGYTQMVNEMLYDADVYLGLRFKDLDKDIISKSKTPIFYTGAVDELMDYELGELGWRSLRFDTIHIPGINNFQATPVVNYPHKDIPYTRIIEHKQFTPHLKVPGTVITTEYPQDWKLGDEPYYPINDENNNMLQSQYIELAKSKYPTMIFAGRMGNYKYYDMDIAIEKAFDVLDEYCGTVHNFE